MDEIRLQAQEILEHRNKIRTTDIKGGVEVDTFDITDILFLFNSVTEIPEE